MGIFPLRQAIERLRAGLFDPVASDRLTMKDESVIAHFSKGLQALEGGLSSHLCICGAYGEGKSHNLTYLHQQALSQGYAASLLQLDVREVPFHQFSVVYRSLMKSLSLPTGESLAEAWKKCATAIPDDMPHRFRMILQAMASQNKPDHWLEKALLGCDLPITHLKQILNSREVKEYQKQPLTCRGNAPYVQMVQSLGKLLHTMGYKGLVLFFDEAESIAQGRHSNRMKSHEILNQFFQHSGFVYPVFACTEAFFDQVPWKSLQIVRLEDSSLTRWEVLQDRLIHLYAEAYQIDLSTQHLEIKQQMRSLLEKLKTEETRHKLKALIYQLDIRTAS